MNPPPELSVLKEIAEMAWDCTYKYLHKIFLDCLWKNGLVVVLFAIGIASAVWYFRPDYCPWCWLIGLVAVIVEVIRKVCVPQNELTWKDPLIGLALSIVYHGTKCCIDWKISWIDLLMVLFQTFLFCLGQFIRARLSMSNGTCTQAKKYQESEASGNGNIPDEVLDKLSKDLIDYSWRDFFRALDVEESDLVEIQINEPRNVKEQIYQLLCRLKRNGRLNWTSLIDALKKIGRKDLADKYNKKKFPES